MGWRAWPTSAPPREPPHAVARGHAGVCGGDHGQVVARVRGRQALGCAGAGLTQVRSRQQGRARYVRGAGTFVPHPARHVSRGRTGDGRHDLPLPCRSQAARATRLAGRPCRSRVAVVTRLAGRAAMSLAGGDGDAPRGDDAARGWRGRRGFRVALPCRPWVARAT
ncbi:unnamed protein product [[Actinomadura] parvosata subsp. kistnae]|nr:unnamed protein product [Actinomadura parvosata subsp. kistnae]